uniref:Uncharacterized protein n=1 Tax=Anguilla anguilla TaxID=7936 RepID=A0A0E9Q5I8_ANGAN
MISDQRDWFTSRSFVIFLCSRFSCIHSVGPAILCATKDIFDTSRSFFTTCCLHGGLSRGFIEFAV